MHRSADRKKVADAPAWRRWAACLLSILIALSVVLHFGQPVPAHAAMATMEVAATNDDGAPCDASHSPTAAHCGMTTACSLYAPLEASPVTFLAGKSHVLPTVEAVEATWAPTPQLQPPQPSLKF